MSLNRIRNGALASLLVLPLLIHAQDAQLPASVPLPGVHYRYWPKQMVQWVGPELPYSMIVANIDDRGKQPVYDVQLIDKGGKSKIHYTNSTEELALDQRAGFTVYQVAMQFDGPADPEKGAQYLLRFNTETGVPVVWQFVLATDVTDQGSGVSAIPAAFPILSYRGLAGLADQGTALKVGNTTSAADVWKEYAHPPYFVPYHGALSTGVQALSFVPQPASKGDAQSPAKPSTLSVSRNGDTVALSDNFFGTTISYTMDGTSITRVSFAPTKGKREDTVTLEFTPPLASAGQSKFEILVGNKTKIAAGTAQLPDANSPSGSIAWSFSTPVELKGKTATATASARP
jgi:hypothetical protein